MSETDETNPVDPGCNSRDGHGSLRFTVPLLSAAALFGLASGGLFTLIGIELSESGVSEIWIGTVSSAYFLGSLAGSMSASVVIARLGHRFAFRLIAAMAAASTAALVATSSIGAWVLLRLVTGYTVGAYYVVIETWINHLAENTNRGRRLALYECVRMGAIAISPVLARMGSTPIGLLIAAGSFLTAAVPIGRAPHPRARSATPQPAISFLRLLGIAPTGLAACFVAGLLSSTFYGLGAVYAARIGLDRDEIMLFLAATWAAPLIGQIPVGAVADRFGRERVLIIVALCASVAAATISALGQPPFSILIFLTLLVGGLSHPIYALGVGILTDRLPPEAIVRAGTALLVAYSAGTTLGPALGSPLMVLLGAPGLYIYFTGLLVALAGTVLVGRRRLTQSPP